MTIESLLHVNKVNSQSVKYWAEIIDKQQKGNIIHYGLRPETGILDYNIKQQRHLLEQRCLQYNPEKKHTLSKDQPSSTELDTNLHLRIEVFC
jgi:response regulator of citrate/malate metabolism